MRSRSSWMHSKEILALVFRSIHLKCGSYLFYAVLLPTIGSIIDHLLVPTTISLIASWWLWKLNPINGPPKLKIVLGICVFSIYSFSFHPNCQSIPNHNGTSYSCFIVWDWFKTPLLSNIYKASSYLSFSGFWSYFSIYSAIVTELFPDPELEMIKGISISTLIWPKSLTNLSLFHLSLKLIIPVLLIRTGFCCQYLSLNSSFVKSTIVSKSHLSFSNH